MAMTRKTHLLVLGVVVIVGTFVLGKVSGQCNPGTGLAAIQSECSVQTAGPKVSPSPSIECCGVMKRVDIPCICKGLTPIVEYLVSMEKVVTLARTCGVTVPAGLKCGSYTVPPPMP